MAISAYSDFVDLCDRQRLMLAIGVDQPETFAGLGVMGVTSAPGAAATCTRATTGNLWVTPAPATVTNSLYVAEVSAHCLFGDNYSGGRNSGPWWFFDRLAHQSGLDGTVTTEQTTNLPTPALPRYTSGVGVQIGIQAYTNTGATPTTVTVRYTNSDGTGSRTSQPTVFPGSYISRTWLGVTLQDGDVGVKSVEGVTLAASTGTAGNFGVFLYMPLFWAFVERDWIAEVKKNAVIGGGGGLVVIDDDCCLGGILLSLNNNNPNYAIRGYANIIEVA